MTLLSKEIPVISSKSLAKATTLCAFVCHVQACNLDPASFATGGSAAESEPVQVQGPALSKYSTEQMIRGFLLSDGPLAERVPTIQERFTSQLDALTPKQRAETERLLGKLAEKIVTDNPEFATKFRDRILSGDRRLIREAMLDGSVTVVQTMQQMPDFAGMLEVAYHDDGRGLCIPVIVVAGAVVAAYAVFSVSAVVLNVVAAVNIGVYLAIEAWTEVGNPWFQVGGGDIRCNGETNCFIERADSALLLDRVVDEIADERVEVWAFEKDLKFSKTDMYTNRAERWRLTHGDLDCDGRQDRLYYSTARREYRIYSKGEYFMQADYPAASRGNGGQISVGDFDNNGCDDVVYHDPDLSSLQIDFYNGGTYQRRELPVTKASSRQYTAIVGNFVGDQADDIWMWGANGLPDTLYQGSSSRQFAVVPAPALDFNAQVVPVVGKFYASNEMDDILFYGTDRADHTFFDIEPSTNSGDKGDPGTGECGALTCSGGNPGGANVHRMPFPTSDHLWHPVVADFDRNGFDDIYWYSRMDGSVGDSIWMSDGQSMIGYGEEGWGQERTGLYPVAFDVNNSGYPDLFWWPYGSLQVMPQP